MVNNITQTQELNIKNHIRSQLQQNQSQIFSIIGLMEGLISQLDSIQKINAKENRYWNKAFSGQIGNERISFGEIQKNNIKTKTILNSLESLIDILGALLTDRPLTSLIASYKDIKGNIQRIQVNPVQYFQIRQASTEPSRISISSIQQLVAQGQIQIEEENRMLKWLQQNYGRGINKGYKAEAFESSRFHKRISKKRFSDAVYKASHNKTPWNKGGDVNEFQVKYLGTEGNFWSQSRKTASQISIEEIVTYFITLKNSLILNDLESQVNAIFSAFVEVENLTFYGQGGYIQKNADDLIEALKQEWKAAGLTSPS